MHIRELLTVDREISRPKTRSRFIPATRNETIKMMTECPASTSNRIVFLPNLNGVGFRCKIRLGETLPHDSFNEDEKIVDRLPAAVKEQVVSGVHSVNLACYQTWREIKYEQENFPMEREKWLFRVAMMLSLLCIAMFFSFYSDIDLKFWIVHAVFAILAIIYSIVFVAMMMVCCRRTPKDNLDRKVSENIGLQLRHLNKTSRLGLVWRNPRDQVWIYVTIPPEALAD